MGREKINADFSHILNLNTYSTHIPQIATICAPL
ncbi:hypothetical protein HH_0600 [Helicobacter hepaticus ATCC 51449]|uniref:Uncharacterized protein n=1 Tax=Helicobacter hepaticus (strain ATCC 51449 / 3B1) TaxID=235279 RepID=Q7VIK4_HELHP|nr:hypothetical protein HH_0600 [Helicobacter hepaticus ATCC 51449]